MSTPPTPSEAAPARILIVDDHPNTASMLARALGHFDTPVEILTARSGQEALEVVGYNSVDVLITDFMMPGMNGLELIERLQDGREPSHIILITAYDSPGLAATARRLRVNDYLIKPVQPDKIRDLVGAVLTGLHLPKPLFAELPHTSQFKILVADDRLDNVHLLATRLEHEGYTFMTAADGDETLAKMRAEPPDLLLLDVNMPGKNGFEVLAEVRRDPAIAHIPVIILTAARTAPRDIREGLSLGADDYITKPFDWRELAARIRAKLRVKHAEDALRRRNRELGLLPEIGQDLTARSDLKDLAGVILRRAVEATGATNGHIVIFHVDGAVFYRMHLPRDFSPWSWEQAKQRLASEGLVGYVAASGEGLLVLDTRTDSRWLRTPKDPARSAVAVPLLSRRGVIGALILEHEQPSYFTNDNLTLLKAIGSQAAIAIENAQFYAIEHRRVNELVALHQFAREISLFTQPDELFERAPQLIREAFGYPVVTLWLTEGGNPMLRCISGQPSGGGPGGSLRRSVLALAPEQVAATGQPALVSGSVEERTTPRADPGVPPTHSAAAVPLFWAANVSGVLAIHSPRPNAFQESDRVLLETLAAQIATAIDRMRLIQMVQQAHKQLSAVLGGATDAILVRDAQGRVQTLSPAGQQLFGEGEAQLGKPLPPEPAYADLLHLLDQARESAAVTRGQIGWPDHRAFAAVVTPIEKGGEVAILTPQASDALAPAQAASS